MRVSATTASRETPRCSRAAMRVLPRLGSPSAPGLSGSGGAERAAAPASSASVAPKGCVSPPRREGLDCASPPSRGLAPDSSFARCLVSLPEFTVSSVSRAADIRRSPLPTERTCTLEARADQTIYDRRNLQLARLETKSPPYGPRSDVHRRALDGTATARL